MKALLVVDIQNDFLPGGALGVNGGNEIIPIVNALLEKPFDLIVACKDWHPLNHCSFAKTHNKRVGDQIELMGRKQILWPVHCVQNTFGAEFSSKLDSSKIEKTFLKGTEAQIDSYGAFFDNGHLRSTGLDDYLKSKKITDLYIAGLTTDYCVKYTVLDACKLKYNTYVIQDGCRAVNLNPGDGVNALDLMAQSGAHIINSIECIF